ncbi:hypothetical protein [uncultured Fluviicola sp.]|uniref:hypothetical protein n=1 Tax=uncultured Fluviicola sp. TaxID=463303 RepID=UPI0026008EDF|nr:hypothetical protein [uncultured Fluviicola sp.]
MEKQLKIVRILAICLLLFTAVSALTAGILFISDPSGQKMGMSTTYLASSPFSTYLLPGWVLLIVNGLMNVLAAIACIIRSKHYQLFVILQGILLSGWIIIQVILVKDLNVLHYSMFSIGVLLICCGIILQKLHKNKNL